MSVNGTWFLNHLHHAHNSHEKSPNGKKIYLSDIYSKHHIDSFNIFSFLVFYLSWRAITFSLPLLLSRRPIITIIFQRDKFSCAWRVKEVMYIHNSFDLTQHLTRSYWKWDENEIYAVIIISLNLASIFRRGRTCRQSKSHTQRPRRRDNNVKYKQTATVSCAFSCRLRKCNHTWFRVEILCVLIAPYYFAYYARYFV